MTIRKYQSIIEDGLLALIRESEHAYTGEKLDNPQAASDMLNTVFRHGQQSDEVAYMIALDNRLNCVGVFEIGRGNVNACIMDPASIYKRALLCNASNIMLAHNHPGGDPIASQADIETTRRIKQAGELLGIQLVDHIIVTDRTTTSLQANGLMG